MTAPSRVILITGSRHWPDKPSIWNVMRENKDCMFIFGDCPTGADFIAWRFAVSGNLQHKRFEANWLELGQAAGPIRNQAMVNYGPDEAYAFTIPGCRGTIDCMKRCIRSRIPVTEIKIEDFR